MPSIQPLDIELKNLLLSDAEKYGLSKSQIEACVQQYQTYTSTYSEEAHQLAIRTLIKSARVYHHNDNQQEDININKTQIERSLTPVKVALFEALHNKNNANNASLEHLRQTLQTTLQHMPPQNKNGFLTSLWNMAPESPFKHFNNQVIGGGYTRLEPNLLGWFIFIAPIAAYLCCYALTTQYDKKNQALTPDTLTGVAICNEKSEAEITLTFMLHLFNACSLLSIAPELAEHIYKKSFWPKTTPISNTNNKNNKKETTLVTTDTIKQLAQTEEPHIVPGIQLVWCLSGRTSVLGDDVDQLKRPFDPKDDITRMLRAIEIADEINAKLAGKRVKDLTDKDRIIKIYYNGRKTHNHVLREALDQSLLPYPKHLFIIEDINPENTIGQVQDFERFLREKSLDYQTIAVVTSEFHRMRAALTSDNRSPQAENAFGHPNALSTRNYFFYGIDKAFKAPGTKIDLTNTRTQSSNIFLKQSDVLTYVTKKSFNRLSAPIRLGLFQFQPRNEYFMIENQPSQVPSQSN